MSLMNLVNFGGTGGVGGTALLNNAHSQSQAASEASSPMAAGVTGGLEQQFQMQVNALQQMLNGCQNGGSGEQVAANGAMPMLDHNGMFP